jgi:hypothetical protein
MIDGRELAVVLPTELDVLGRPRLMTDESILILPPQMQFHRPAGNPRARGGEI